MNICHGAHVGKTPLFWQLDFDSWMRIRQNQTMQVILASQSQYRQAQLKQIGINFTAAPAHVDEETPKKTFAKPIELAQHLAKIKGEKIAEKYPEALIIAADQLVAFAGQILGKPKTFEGATQQLKQLSGNSHELITALWVKGSSGTPKTHVEIVKVDLRKLSDREIKNYLKFDHPFDCAGAYKFERGGVGLMVSLQCQDPSAIIGLPMMMLSKFLTEFGVELFSHNHSHNGDL